MPDPKVVAHTITKADMKRRLKVSTTAVSQACRIGGRLEPALIGNKINVRHPAALKWIAERDAIEKEINPPPTVAESEEELGPWRAKIDLESLEEPLKTLTEKYGNAKEMEKWVVVRGKLATARKQEAAQARFAGRLISRTTVDRMLDHLDVGFRLLLSDAPRTIATRIAPDDMAATAAIVRDAMEQILESARSQMMMSLAADDPLAPLMEADAAE